MGMLHQIGQLLQVGSIHVAHQHVTKSILRPGLKVKRGTSIRESCLANTELRCIAKDKCRDEVALIGEDQVRTGLLVEIGDASASESEVRALQVRKIKGEGNAPLKPRLYGVAVGRAHVGQVRGHQRDAAAMTHRGHNPTLDLPDGVMPMADLWVAAPIGALLLDRMLARRSEDTI